MDIGTFRGITALLVMIAFLGVVFWAYSKRRKQDFDEAKNLPFADEDDQKIRDSSYTNDRTTSRQDEGDKNS
ncbi:cbb3-type cytochrome oxidase subunit 3 [Halomonas sp. M20]|uniref:cbb3-type cytochrome oxidase subunit 3 n=1 Tax=Halomonas sp. M20 TaxID=2763264 RepID=UPI001D0ADC45|nr:cbb3-type cytochrome c oxidase subunit 3 [Halomonas sp. M20]